ncbi:MAG: DUF1697 domain-containing protein [Homoserinimonas sp.]
MPRYVALLRGINVGTAKHVPMADLKLACENLGGRCVTTVLRSGSVVFDADSAPDAPALEAEVERLTSVDARAMILAAHEFAEITSANPLVDVATSGSKLFTTFLSEPVDEVDQLVQPDAADLAPEVLRVGRRAVYQWVPGGSLQTKVPKGFWAQFSGIRTARNANTVERILTLLSEESENPRSGNDAPGPLTGTVERHRVH